MFNVALNEQTFMLAKLSLYMTLLLLISGLAVQIKLK